MSKYDNWTLAKLKAEKSKLLKKYNEYHEVTRAINDMVNTGEWICDTSGAGTFDLSTITADTSNIWSTTTTT